MGNYVSGYIPKYLIVMDKFEIRAINESFAEFLDYVKDTVRRQNEPKKWRHPDDIIYLPGESIKFHKRYDFLMPVFDKIKELPLNGFNYDAENMAKLRRNKETILALPISTPFGDLYREAAAFVKWYLEAVKQYNESTNKIQ
jgi:hypothetical protein